MSETVIATLDGFVRLTFLPALSVPAGTLPKLREVGASVSDAVPEPVSATLWGLLVPVLTIDTVPVRAPMAAGWKVTVNVQFPPAVTTPVQVPGTAVKSPEPAIDPIVMGTAVEFVNLTALAVLTVPAA